MRNENSFTALVGKAKLNRIRHAAGQRWASEKVQDWYKAQAWPCGFNFLPSSAVNFLEMWAAETFDESTIDRELRWASEVGFNSLRTNLPFIVWQQDPLGLISRISKFLGIAADHKLTTILCPFDDCGFSGDEPKIGLQPAPIPGVHNSRAVASPGRATVMNQSARQALRSYITDIISTFGDDRRILFWDLYNEPGNRSIFSKTGEKLYTAALELNSFDLMIETFEWARELAPDHPLSVGAWRLSEPQVAATLGPFVHPIDQAALMMSDVINFHAYCDSDRMKSVIEFLQPLGRPLLCTEWMARGIGSRVADQLPLFQKERIGAWQWGLVRGRTQTHIPWPNVKASMTDNTEGTFEWFHDFFDLNGQPYDSAEADLVKSLTK